MKVVLYQWFGNSTRTDLLLKNWEYTFFSREYGNIPTLSKNQFFYLAQNNNGFLYLLNAKKKKIEKHTVYLIK